MAILKDLDQPLTAEDIRQRAKLNRDADVIRTCLQGLKREGLIRGWRSGYFVHKAYAGDGVGTHKRVAKPKAMKSMKTTKPEVEPTADLDDRIAAQLDQLQAKLVAKPVTVSDRRLKIQVLERLRGMMADDIGALLDEMIGDYERLPGD